jgi:hypothetical protein
MGIRLTTLFCGAFFPQCGLLVTAAAYYREAVVVCAEHPRAMKLLGRWDVAATGFPYR